MRVVVLRKKAIKTTVDQNLKIRPDRTRTRTRPRTRTTRTKKITSTLTCSWSWSSPKISALLFLLLTVVYLIWIGFETTRQLHYHAIAAAAPPPAPPVPPPINKIIKVACVGDSLTRGDDAVVDIYESKYDRDDYPTQLQNLLGKDTDQNTNTNKNTFQVQNFGVRGVTAIGGLNVSYNKTREYRQSLQFQPDIVLFMLGTNDAKFWERHGKNNNRFEHDYSQLVTTFQNNNNHLSSASSTSASSASPPPPPPPPQVIVAMTPWAQKDFGRIKDLTLVQHINPAIQSVAAQLLLRTPVVDMRAATYGNESLYIDDGLHLNAHGYAVLAKAWKNVIIQVVDCILHNNNNNNNNSSSNSNSNSRCRRNNRGGGGQDVFSVFDPAAAAAAAARSDMW